MSRIYLSPPHMGLYEMEYVTKAFVQNWIAPAGPHITAFEQQFASYVESAGAVALSSATAGIHLALRLIGVGPGDLVLCSTLTFVATANPIVYLGAEPVFIDSEPNSWNMSAQALEEACHKLVREGRKPKAIIIVHLYGQNADMSELSRICDHYGIPIIEDAAESLGATYKGKASGTMGTLGVYSFNGNKIITTSGGGMLVSDNLELLEKARFWSTQAKDPAPHYEHSEIGYNYRMSNVLAGIGRGQMHVLEDRIAARRDVFARYKAALGNIEGLSFMPEMAYGRSTRWLTALTINPNDCPVTSQELVQVLAQNNIEARPVWKPLHLQPLYRTKSYFSHEGSHVAEQLFEHGICLPSGSNLSEVQQQYVIDSILHCLQEAGLKV